MIRILRTLFAPLNYLRARNPDKLRWDWVIPVAVAVVGTACLFLLPKPIPVLGDKGLIYWVNELLKILVGFYIAALAAVATFASASLDQEIEGEGVILEVERADGKEDKRLSRRAFLSLMFGYLSLLAILLYCAGLVVTILTENIRLIDANWLPAMRAAFVFAYSLFFTQMLTVTLVALFYLSDRIHRQTPQALPPQDVKRPK